MYCNRLFFALAVIATLFTLTPAAKAETCSEAMSHAKALAVARDAALAAALSQGKTNNLREANAMLRHVPAYNGLGWAPDSPYTDVSSDQIADDVTARSRELRSSGDATAEDDLARAYRKQFSATQYAQNLADLCSEPVSGVSSADAAIWRLDVNIGSVHTEAWARNSLNQRNPGVGLEWAPSRTWAVAFGEYWNSYRRATAYVLGEWTPIQLGDANDWHLDAGVGAGFASGYRHNEVATAPFVGAAIVRLVSPSGFALNVVGVPNAGAEQSGFIGFQLAVPLSR